MGGRHAEDPVVMVDTKGSLRLFVDTDDAAGTSDLAQIGDNSPSPTGLGLRASCYIDGFSARQREEEEAAGSEETPNRPQEEPAASDTRPSLVSRADIMSRSMQGTTDSEKKLKPDFTGVWKMIRCEGDFDGFMKEMGVNWALRRAAGAVGYGVNATFHTIRASETEIHVETKNPKGIFVKDVQIDGTEQDDVDPVHRKPIKIIPYWEVTADKVTLTMEAFMPVTNGEAIKMPLTRRYMEGASMVVEQTSPEGVVVRRVFALQ